MFLTSSFIAPLGDATPVLFLYRIAESVSRPTLIHLGGMITGVLNRKRVLLITSPLGTVHKKLK